MTEIRAANLHDLPGAYRVCLYTGESGQDASAIYRDPDLLGHVYVGPYIVGQTDLARVVTDGEGVGGYLLAALDTRAFEAWMEAHWWPMLRDRFPVSEGDSPDERIVRLLHSPPRASATVIEEYPAELHIDLLPRVRGQGYGRRLIEGLAGDLRARGSRGVHLGVAADNDNAIAFYGHLGFAELARGDASIVMGMRL